jgi:hypothetical protein
VSRLCPVQSPGQAALPHWRAVPVPLKPRHDQSCKTDPRPLSVRERVLLFCVASGTEPEAAGITGETVTGMIVKGMVERDTGGRLSLTDDGRAALRRLLPEQ